MPEFKKQILIYIPCHNCEDGVVDAISGIPSVFHGQIECLVVDNCSTDRTSEFVLQGIKKGKWPFKISLIRTRKDIGYAGSQKLAYFLACSSPMVKHVVMLHGDGQYSPSLLPLLISETDKNYAIVNGYRDRKTYPQKEETPFMAYNIVKILSRVESLITGYAQKEWHSGFVMYTTGFLKKIPLQYLTNSRHIDGEFLICAGVLGEKTLGVPIYKKYIGYKAYTGLPRIRYVLVDVPKIIISLKRKFYHKLLRKHAGSKVNFDFDVIA